MLLSRWLPALRARLHALVRRQRLEREVDTELRFHLDQQIAEHLERGMSRKEAARAARATLGNLPLIREDVRAVWRWRWLDQLGQDVRCGARTLTRSRGFSAMSVATLALAIGATTAIFSVVYGILLRPLPVAEPERLVRIVNIAYIGELVELRARARTLDRRGLSAVRRPNPDRPRRAVAAERRVGHRRPADPRRQDAGPRSGLRARRRAPRGRAVRHPEPRAVAPAFRRGSGDGRTDATARRRRAHGARGHAAGLRASLPPAWTCGCR